MVRFRASTGRVPVKQTSLFHLLISFTSDLDSFLMRENNSLLVPYSISVPSAAAVVTQPLQSGMNPDLLLCRKTQFLGQVKF